MSSPWDCAIEEEDKAHEAISRLGAGDAADRGVIHAILSLTNAVLHLAGKVAALEER